MSSPRRENLRLAIPLILSNLTVPFLGMVDTAVVGRLDGPQYLGAVALGAAVMSMILWVFGFLRMGTSGFTAQAFGRTEGIEIKAILIRSAILALGIGSTISLLAPGLIHLAASVYSVDGELLRGFTAYLGIRMWGAPAMLLNHVFVGWFLGRQNPYVPLIMMVCANGLNAGLDIYFVFGLGMGVDGVAYATVLADYAGSLIGACMAVVTWRQLGRGNPTSTRLLDARIIVRFLTFGRDMFLRTLLMQMAFFGFTAIGARQGEVMLAVNAVLMNFFTLQSNGLDGFADATEAMTGKAVGRRRVDELRAAFHAGLTNGLVLTAALAIGFWFWGQAIVDLLTTIEDVRTSASEFLIYVAILPLVSITAFICDGLYFGATRGADLRNSLVVSAGLFAVAALVLVPAFDNHGLWIAFLAFMAARGLTLVWIYRRADSGAGFVAGSVG